LEIGSVQDFERNLAYFTVLGVRSSFLEFVFDEKRASFEQLRMGIGLEGFSIGLRFMRRSEVEHFRCVFIE
jgi:hypothetical protein